MRLVRSTLTVGIYIIRVSWKIIPRPSRTHTYLSRLSGCVLNKQKSSSKTQNKRLTAPMNIYVRVLWSFFMKLCACMKSPNNSFIYLLKCSYGALVSRAASSRVGLWFFNNYIKRTSARARVKIAVTPPPFIPCRRHLTIFQKLRGEISEIPFLLFFFVFVFTNNNNNNNNIKKKKLYLQ